MNTSNIFTPSSTPILFLGGLMLITSIVFLLLIISGLRSLAQGRDTVCTIAWRLPSRLSLMGQDALATGLQLRDLPATLASLCHTRLSHGAILAHAMQASRSSQIAGPTQVLSVLYIRMNYHLARRQANRPRRPIQIQRYQTVGERMRTRSMAA